MKTRRVKSIFITIVAMVFLGQISSISIFARCLFLSNSRYISATRSAVWQSLIQAAADWPSTKRSHLRPRGRKLAKAKERKAAGEEILELTTPSHCFLLNKKPVKLRLHRPTKNTKPRHSLSDPPDSLEVDHGLPSPPDLAPPFHRP